MKIIKFISKYSNNLFFDQAPVIPAAIVRESIDSEIKAANLNSFTYWDHFTPENIRRSNVMKNEILKAQTEKNVSRRRVSRR